MEKPNLENIYVSPVLEDRVGAILGDALMIQEDLEKALGVPVRDMNDILEALKILNEYCS